MKSVVTAALALSLIVAGPAFGAATAPAGQAAAARNPAHVKAVQDLLGAMQVEKLLRGVAARTRYPNDAQRQAMFAKLDRMPPAEVYQRMAAPLADRISADTAAEMTRFYHTPYGKQLIHKKYNNSGGIMFPAAVAAVPPEEKQERKRAAYVQASKELAAAEPAIDHEAFVLLQAINKEKR